MSLNVKEIKSESKFERPPALDAGTYPGRVVQLIGLGLQAQDPWKGEAKPPKQELRTVYELADEFLLDEDGKELTDKPRWVDEEFAVNSIESDLAKSTHRYTALDPEMEHDGDFFALIGSPCLITLTKTPSKKEKGVYFNNVKSVQSMRAKDAAKAPDLVNPSRVFDMYEPVKDVFLSLPNFVQDKIKKGLDFGGSDLETMLEDEGHEEKKEPEQDQSDQDKDTDNSDEGDW